MTQVTLAVVAVLLGVLVAILAFVPYVMVTIRRHGRFGVRRALASLAFVIYAIAIWVYTLLPMPLPADVRCVGTNLDPMAFVDDVVGAISRGHPLTDFAVLQLALNVLLFVPLGFFLRLLFHRGIVVAFGVGLALSLLIELTQLTGVWGIYPCAYRVFDVDDLLTNTLGAVLGSLFSLALPRAWRLSAADAVVAARPTPVTRGRRLLAMLVDVIGTLLVVAALGVAVRVPVYLFGSEGALRSWEELLATGSAAVVLLLTGIITVATGYTLGDAAVRLEYRGSRLPTPIARTVRFVGGIGGLQLLWLFSPADSFWEGLFVLASVVCFFATSAGRGLPGLLSGQRLVDARAEAGRAQASDVASES